MEDLLCLWEGNQEKKNKPIAASLMKGKVREQKDKEKKKKQKEKEKTNKLP